MLPRLAVLQKELTTRTQVEAFEALLMDLARYCQQTNSVIEDLREMARVLKHLEDDVTFDAHDLQQLRDLYRRFPDSYQRFDPEAYKRSTLVTRDLSEGLSRVDWDAKAAVGRRLDGLLEQDRVRREEEAAERHKVWAKEQKAKHETELLKRFGVLYKTGPQGVDGSIPKNVRADMPAAEKRLAQMGFLIEVDGHVRCCQKAWGEFIVYADPRGGNSVTFNVYKGSQALHTFWVKDKLGNLQKKVEAQLTQLQEQDRAAEGLLDCRGLAGILQVSVVQVESLIEHGIPVFMVGSVARFDREKVLEWLKNQEVR